jgi:hypothetical protein
MAVSTGENSIHRAQCFKVSGIHWGVQNVSLWTGEITGFYYLFFSYGPHNRPTIRHFTQIFSLKDISK